MNFNTLNILRIEHSMDKNRSFRFFFLHNIIFKMGRVGVYFIEFACAAKWNNREREIKAKRRNCLNFERAKKWCSRQFVYQIKLFGPILVSIFFVELMLWAENFDFSFKLTIFTMTKLAQLKSAQNFRGVRWWCSTLLISSFFGRF